MLRIGSDEHYDANADILDGVRFIATLQLRIPLRVLEHHGEIFRGPPSQAPVYGDAGEGMWIPHLRHSVFDDLGFPRQHASDVGNVDPDKYIPFLIAFRTIVEGNDSHDLKIKQIHDLRKHSPEFAGFWKTLKKNYHDFPHSFFYFRFTEIPGGEQDGAKAL
jgi:hypothetical protein